MTTAPVPFTLRSAAGLPTAPEPLASAALLIIDAQQEYGPTGMLPLCGLAQAVAQAAALLASARQSGAPVIHIAHLGAPGGMFDPEHGGRFLPELAPTTDEPVISKTLPNAFAGTELSVHLSSLGNPPIVIAGFMTHMCVSATARAALDLGHTTTVAGDATATRALPPADGTTEPIPAEVMHRAALAAIADRFSLVTTTAALLGP